MKTTEWAEVIWRRASAVSSGKADDHAARHHGQRHEMGPLRVRPGGRPAARWRPEAGHRGARHGDENGIEPDDGKPRGRQRALKISTPARPLSQPIVTLSHSCFLPLRSPFGPCSAHPVRTGLRVHARFLYS